MGMICIFIGARDNIFMVGLIPLYLIFLSSLVLLSSSAPQVLHKSASTKMEETLQCIAVQGG